MSDQYILEMKDIVKEFSGVRVLHKVNFNVKKGEVHALVGENGAGKSTLMKILSGAYPFGEYEGKLIFDNEEIKFSDIKSAENSGIEIVYQELEVVPYMTVAENIFLGNEPSKKGFVDFNEMNSKAEELLKKVNLKVKTDSLVEYLGVGKRQLVVIAKALSRKVRLLILDEPTAALTESEIEKLLNIIKELKKQNVTCIYISHKLNEVLSIADTITILRDGRTIITEPKEAMTEEKMIRHMVGREIGDRFPREQHTSQEVIFSVRDYSFTEKTTGRLLINQVSFDLKKGEILGIAGLMGAGRTELVMSLLGAMNGKKIGKIYLEGQEISIRTPMDAINLGIGLVVEDRKDKGLVLCLDIQKNSTLSSLKDMVRHWLIDDNEAVRKTNEFVKSMGIKAPGIEIETGRLSGGNQQKVVIAKVLMSNPKVLIMDEPTRGIDVGAKHEIYIIMNKLIKLGVSIIMISSELPEVMGMADRIMVMKEGRITGELDIKDANQEKIMRYATQV